MNNLSSMITRVKKIDKVFLLLLIATLCAPAGIAQENLSREVKLYNPFVPTLSKENKLSFMPDMNDTTIIQPIINYSISPRPFMPGYNIRTISAARIQPDPLPKLYKGYLNLGFGNYFTPVAELSLTSGRSRDKIIGFYANHTSSFGSVTLENDHSVSAGYMDNVASLYAAKLFRRVTTKANLDFKHIKRTAYGYDTDIIPVPASGKDSLRFDYLNPSAEIRIYSTRIDSAALAFDARVYYDLLYQSANYFQHEAGVELTGGYDFKAFYATSMAGFEYYSFPDLIDNQPRYLARIDAAINRITEAYSVRVGFKTVTFVRPGDQPPDPADHFKTGFFAHPDVRFQFKIVPSFINLFVALDGEFDPNMANTVVYKNPFVVTENVDGQIMPNPDLYTLKSSDTKLRVNGGIIGSAGENSYYSLTASYGLFEDMLFFMNDLRNGRGFLPVYDDGELLNISASGGFRINSRLTVKAEANYYNYTLESQAWPWYKPEWDGNMTFLYNLRDKILATANLTGVGTRHAEYGPMPYSILVDPTIVEMPYYLGLNLGFEYRYTKILSFWTKLQNISVNRYYEWNFYPSQRFLFLAGFTYSL